MIANKIDLETATKLEFKTHTFYVASIGAYTSVYVTINKDVYFEMELSSRNFSYTDSLHDRNLASLAGYIQSMFNISPNPDFIFKPRPIDNERYLMYRYIKSIFQIPNNKLIQFSCDEEFAKFCSINNLEYEKQEWFKRIYLDYGMNVAIDYLVKCSLVFQELYFPENRAEGSIPTLHDAEQLRRSYNFKPDFHEIYDILKRNRISSLYHFTDKSNLDSIKRFGLVSNEELVNRGAKVKYASSSDSRQIDKEMGLSRFVRLSFTKYHPMMYTAMTAYGLNPVIIEFNPLIALMLGVFFSDRNSLKNGANLGPSAQDLNKVRFSAINDGVAYYNKSLDDKMYCQAEVIVKDRIGAEFITNVIIP